MRRIGLIKPLLTEAAKVKRMEFTFSSINEGTRLVEPMYNMVHIDEKWFGEDVEARSYLLLLDEPVPQRHRRRKRLIPRTMFLAPVARPRYVSLFLCTVQIYNIICHRKTMFKGKLGIWDLTEQYIAQRSSANRPRGSLLTRNIDLVTREVIKNVLLQKVIPVIKWKWPARDRGVPILIQQDNAKPHVSRFDPDIIAAGTANGWKIQRRRTRPTLTFSTWPFFCVHPGDPTRRRARPVDNDSQARVQKAAPHQVGQRVHHSSTGVDMHPSRSW